MINLHLLSALCLLAYCAYPLRAMLPSKGRHLFKFCFNYFFATLGIVFFSAGSWKAILLCLAIGIVYLPLMVATTSPTFRYILNFRLNLLGWLRSVPRMWKMHLTVVVKAAQEEVIWRGALFAIGSFLGISGGYLVAVVTVLFYAVHIHLDRKIVLVTQLELLTFSFVLSLAYAEVGSLIGTLLIHVIRNSYIKFARPEEELHQSEANLPALTHGSSGYTSSGEIEVAISATEKKE